MRYGEDSVRQTLRCLSSGLGPPRLGMCSRWSIRWKERCAVHRAIDSGINFFDVSPYYGLTLAEQRLGTALVGRRQEVILATKCGRYGADDFDFSARTIVDGVDASLRRLENRLRRSASGARCGVWECRPDRRRNVAGSTSLAEDGKNPLCRNHGLLTGNSHRNC